MKRKRLHLVAPAVRIAAKGLPRFSMIANSGHPMSIEGFERPVVVDLASLKPIRAKLPILYNHDIERPVGHLESASVGSLVLLARGVLSVETAEGQLIVAAARNGYQWQASIGAMPGKLEARIEEVVTVNGRNFKGPLLIARGATIKELSFVTMGADPNTAVAIAARKAAQLKGKDSMTFEEWVTSIGLDPANLTDEQRTQLKEAYDAIFTGPGVGGDPVPTTPPPAAAAAERARIAAIDSLIGQSSHVEGTSDLRIRAIAHGLSVDETRERMLGLIRAARTPGPTPVRGSAGMSVNHMTAGLMVRAGFAKAAEKQFGPRIMEDSKRFHAMALPDMAAAALQMDGRDAPAGGRAAMIRAALSGGSLPTALGSSADKILVAAYMTAAAPWRSFAAIKSLPNFRQHTGIRPTFATGLKKLPAGVSIEHGSITEETYLWKIDTFARQLKIDRQDWINDDLNAFSDVLPSFGRAAARTLNDLVAFTILANADRSGTQFWSSGHSNLNTSSALAIATLGTAIKALRVMTDAEGNLLDLEPGVLYAPANLEGTARGLLESLELNQTAADAPTGNIQKGAAALVIDPRLDTGLTFEGVTQSGSTTSWYLMAGVENASVVVGFLDGRETPITESFGLDADPNVLAFHFRVYHDCGAALADYRTSIKSTA